MQIIPGPDFPTAIKRCKSGFFKLYSTGRGKLIVREKADWRQSSPQIAGQLHHRAALSGQQARWFRRLFG